MEVSIQNKFGALDLEEDDESKVVEEEHQNGNVVKPPRIHHFISHNTSNENSFKCRKCKVVLSNQVLQLLNCLACGKLASETPICHGCRQCEHCLAGKEKCNTGPHKTSSFPSPNQIDLVVYHSSCTDGFAAAWCAWKLLGDKCRYIPVKHGDPPPPIGGKHIAILDFGYDKNTTQHILNKSQGMIMLDHHKSTMLDLGHLPNTFFDLNRSAATIAWNYFHPGKPMPLFLHYIEDRDLWLWRKEGSKAFSAHIGSVSFSFKEYDKYTDEKYLAKAVERGTILSEYVESQIDRLAQRAVIKKFHNYNVLVLNSATWISELGNKLATRTDCDFAMVWNYDHTDDSIRVSLRASTDKVDVSVIAKKYKGGGHPKASAFKWTGSIEKLFDSTSNKKRK